MKKKMFIDNIIRTSNFRRDPFETTGQDYASYIILYSCESMLNDKGC